MNINVLGLHGALAANESSVTWPPKSERVVWEDIALLAALRTSDEKYLRMMAGVQWQYPYLITPVPRMLSRASANMLFGEPPEIGEDDERDQANIERINEGNGLDAELVRGALISSSEGEAWGRVMVRPDLADVPIIEFVSRSRVVPEFSGRFLTGASFVTTWQVDYNDFIRLIERHTAGLVQHLLYRGTQTQIGYPMSLASFEPTAMLPEQRLTGIDKPLVAFIPNSIDANPSRGFSDYRGLEARFFSLNDAATVGHKNVKLTGLKRALIDGAYVGGRSSADDTLLVRNADDGTAGEALKPLEVLEYTFEAGELVAWVDHLIDSAITFAGMSPASVGRGDMGGAISGTAMRLKMAHSLIESSGKGRHFDAGMKQLLSWAKTLDSRPISEGGFGRKYTNPVDVPPSFERADPLPRDDMEAAQRLVLLTNAEAISTEEKVAILHPDWSQDEIDAEVKAIQGTAAASEPTGVPSVTPGGNALTPPRPELTLPPGGGAPGAPA